jgi:hypothetical protein
MFGNEKCKRSMQCRKRLTKTDDAHKGVGRGEGVLGRLRKNLVLKCKLSNENRGPPPGFLKID